MPSNLFPLVPHLGTRPNQKTTTAQVNEWVFVAFIRERGRFPINVSNPLNGRQTILIISIPTT